MPVSATLLPSWTRLRAVFVVCLSLLAASVAPVRAMGGTTEVDVELVLAVDISYSMDEEEQRLQRAGYIAALQSGEFLDALKSGPYGRIAVAYLEWANYNDQRVVIPFTLIDGQDSAKGFAEKLAEAPYRRARRTSISGAIEASVRLFHGNGFDGTRRVIDVSGDGANNDGRPVTQARDAAVADGFVINGLPLVLNRPNYGFADIANLDEYYQDCVIGGPGSFMIPIRDHKQFVEATRTKLVMEVASLTPLHEPRLIHRAQAREPRVSCMIGERMWNQRWGN